LDKIAALSTSSDIIMKKEIPAIILAVLDETKSFHQQIRVIRTFYFLKIRSSMKKLDHI
jgi:hypothetical protein